MEKKYADLSGIRHDDIANIFDFERKSMENTSIGNEDFSLYIIRLMYKDGTHKDIRVCCELGTRDQLSDEELKTFFVDRLFGDDGLIVKQQRNDFIFLGGINTDPSSNSRYSRFNKASDGREMQEVFDAGLSDFFKKMSFQKRDEDWDLVDMNFYFHTGREDMMDTFKNGLRSRFGSGGRDGFCCLGSTLFCPIQ